jgi:phage tail sheath gpL-like
MSIDASARARVVGITTAFKNLQGGVSLLPQHIALIGQGNSAAVYPANPAQFTSAFEAAQVYGFGSPIHLAMKQLFPDNGDGVGTIPVTVFPLVDDAAGVVSTGNITPAGAPSAAGSFQVVINNIASETFVISVGDLVADIVTAMTTAINAVLEMPVIAVDGVTKVDFTSKWEGTSANDIFVEVVGPTDINVTFDITQPVGGLVNPDVQDALDLFGTDVYYTMLLNCMNIADTATLDLYDTFGEGRWGALVKKPLVVFTGNTETTVTAATAVSDVRTLDRTNAQLVAPASNDLPFVVASRQLARIVAVANNVPPKDYGSQDATGLTPGADGDQWTYADRDSAIKKGSSSIQVKAGIINLSDTVTFYHPLGDQNPAYRYVVDIVKLQNIIFSLDNIFNTPEWDGAPLIPDGQATTEPTAKSPKAATAVVASMIDSLALKAIISDPETAKASIVSVIDSGNPKRLNITFTVQLSGNSNIINIDFNFGFFFGTQPIVS